MRLRENPIAPVAQNVQAIAQPTCVDTHSVVRDGSGISTASICASSAVRRIALTVPSFERSTRSTSSDRVCHSCSSFCRSARSRLVISDSFSTPWVYSQPTTWSALYGAMPRALNRSRSCCGV